MLGRVGKKKLQDAARHWLNARASAPDELSQDLISFGIDPHDADLDDHQQNEFPVFQENWDTLNAFLRFQTQWRVGMNGVTGLDYAAIQAGLRMSGQRMRPQVFEGLQAMEFAVLSAVAEDRARS